MKAKQKKTKPFELNSLPHEWANIIFLGLSPTLYEEIKKCDDYTKAKELVGEKTLSSFLKLAIPVWVNNLKQKDLAYIMERKTQIASIIGEKGDHLLYPSPKNKKGITEEVFNAFAEGGAILAMLAKGGVELYGEKFDYETPSHWGEE